MTTAWRSIAGLEPPAVPVYRNNFLISIKAGLLSAATPWLHLSEFSLQNRTLLVITNNRQVDPISNFDKGGGVGGVAGHRDGDDGFGWVDDRW